MQNDPAEAQSVSLRSPYAPHLRARDYRACTSGALYALSFIPFGILLAVGWKRLKTWHLATLGLATSGLIDFVQLFLPTRFSTISDLIANTTGALFGCLYIRLIGWLPQCLHHRDIG